MLIPVDLMIYVLTIVLSVCAAQEKWPIGLIEMLNVDATVASGASGSDVIDAVLDVLDTSGLFLNDRLILRRYALAISNDGLGSYNTTGGVWQASEQMLVSTKRLANLTHMESTILNTFGIQWSTVTQLDMSKPLYSALAFRFYLQTLTHCSLPRTSGNQAAFLIEEIPTTSSVNASSFVESVSARDSKGCSLVADIVFILDGSVDLSYFKTFVQNFISLFQVGSDKTRIAIVQFTDTTNIEFPLDAYSEVQQLSDAIGLIQPLQLTANALVDIPAALTVTSQLFKTERTATRQHGPFSRIAILLTHGQTNDTNGTTSTTGDLQRNDVAVFAIGIGGGVDSAYLQLIASDFSHAAHLSDVNELNEILPEMTTAVCKQSAGTEYGSPIRKTLTAGEKMYVKFTVDPQIGFKMDLSTLIGEVLVYMSTKLKRPNSAVHQWKCRADMTQRGSCFIPPAQLLSLASSSNASPQVITLYATYTTDEREGTQFFTVVSQARKEVLSPLTPLITLCALWWISYR